MNCVTELSPSLPPAIRPLPDVDRESPKAAVDRWFREDVAAKATLKSTFIADLEIKGMRSVRIWRKSYEEIFDLWHFSGALGTVPPNEKTVRALIQGACGKIGFRIKKDLLAVIVERGRCRGMVTLQNAETAKWIRLETEYEDVCCEID